MRQTVWFLVRCGCALILVPLLAACGDTPPASNAPAATSGAATPADTAPAAPPAASPTAPGVITGPTVGTSVTGGTVESPPLRDITPGPFPTEIVLTPGPGGVAVFDSRQGAGAVILPVGGTLRLELEPSYDWTVTVADPSLLSEQSAGLSYRGAAPGVTRIEIQGEPACYKANPPCMAPSFLHSLQVTVK